MAGFIWAGDLNGQKNPITRNYYVPDATAIDRGEPVRFTQGTGIVVLDDNTNLQKRILGVATHDKAASGGTSLEVSISPTAIYKYRADKTYTLTGGSTTTAVDSSLQPSTDDFYNGGAIEIVTCAADSSLIGRIVRITDYDQGTGTMTLAETLPAALASGDTVYICLGNMAEDYLGFDLDSSATAPDFDAVGGTVLRYLYSNPDTMEMFFTFEPWALNAATYAPTV